MNIHEHTTPAKLLYYSFLWNEARLVVAAVSLLIGGSPIVFSLTPYAFFGIVVPFLKIAWIISGAAALYLAYRWYHAGRTLFGGDKMIDVVAFAIAILSGLHLGIGGVTNINIGMTVIPSAMLPIVFVLAGLVYAWSAYYLWRRWKTSGERLF